MDEVVVAHIDIRKVIDDARLWQHVALNANFAKFLALREADIIHRVQDQVWLVHCWVDVHKAPSGPNTTGVDDLRNVNLVVPLHERFQVENVRPRDLGDDVNDALPLHRRGGHAEC
jgi:hypothetical protein